MAELAAQQLLAYCARISSTANQHKHETGPRLLAYLCRNAEWSPFEMASMTMEIRTTRDIARQLLRHRSFSFQEFSQRYAEVIAPFVIRETRLQDHKDRQNSIELDRTNIAHTDLDQWWRAKQSEVAALVDEAYREALQKGIAKEQARAILPEGMTPSSLYVAGTVRSWIHYVALRQSRKTQKEHRLLALGARKVLLQQFPDVLQALPELEIDEDTGVIQPIGA